MSWTFEEVNERRAEAQAVLDRVKTLRRPLAVHYERIDECTWVERRNNPKPLKTNTMTTSITREEAEQAIALYRTAKTAKQHSESQMAEAERIIEAYGNSHLDQFVEGRLALDSGTLALRAGAAKPLQNGLPMNTSARNELAARLPAAYVRLACDFGKLFGCADKNVRRLLTTQGIEIVREDRIVVL